MLTERFTLEPGGQKVHEEDSLSQLTVFSNFPEGSYDMEGEFLRADSLILLPPPWSQEVQMVTCSYRFQTKLQICEQNHYCLSPLRLMVDCNIAMFLLWQKKNLLLSLCPFSSLSEGITGFKWRILPRESLFVSYQFPRKEFISMQEKHSLSPHLHNSHQSCGKTPRN